MKTTAFILLSFLSVSFVYADTIIFRNGQEVDGRIINQSRTTVTVRTDGGAVRTYQKGVIARIAYGDAYRRQQDEKKRREEQLRLEKEKLERERLEREETERLRREQEKQEAEANAEKPGDQKEESESQSERQSERKILQRHKSGIEIYAGITNDASPYTGWSNSIDFVSVLFGELPMLSDFTVTGSESVGGLHLDYTYNDYYVAAGAFRTSQSLNGLSLARGQGRPFLNPDGTVTDPGISEEFLLTSLSDVSSTGTYFRFGYSLYRNRAFDIRLLAGLRSHKHSAVISETEGTRYSLVVNEKLTFIDSTLDTNGFGGEAGLFLSYDYLYYIPWRVHLEFTGGNLTGDAKLSGFAFTLNSTGGGDFRLDGFESETESSYGTFSLGLYGNVWKNLWVFTRIHTYEIETKPVTFRPSGDVQGIFDPVAYLIQSEIINTVAASNISGKEVHRSFQAGLRYEFDFL